MGLYIWKCFACLDGHQTKNFPTMRADLFLPEEGVMFNADLPQPLGGSVIGKLKTDCTFKLLVLEGKERHEEKVSWGSASRTWILLKNQG